MNEVIYKGIHLSSAKSKYFYVTEGQTTSLVDDMIMPAVGMLLGKVEFKDLQIVLQSEVLNEFNAWARY